MNSGSGGLVRHSAVYFIGSLVAVLGGVLMLPVYTHALAPGQYGLLETMLRFVSVCMAVGFVGVRQGYARFYFENDTEQWHRSLTFTVVIANVGIACFVMLPVLTLVALLGKHLGAPDLPVTMGAVLAAWLAGEATFMLGLTQLQVRMRSSQYVLAQVARLSILLGANYFFLHQLRMGFEGAILGNLVAALASGIAAALLMLRGRGLHWSSEHCRKTLQYGLPYIPTALLTYLQTNADRFAILLFGSMPSLGLLSLASKIGEMALSVFYAPVESVWTPFAFRVHADPDGPQRIGGLFTRYVALCVLLALGVSLAAPLAVRLLATSSYASAAGLVPIVALGWVFNVLAELSDIGILIAKKTHLKPRVAAAAAVIAVLLQLCLTPTFGIFGAATATALTYCALFVINMLVARRLYRFVAHGRDFIAIACAAAGGYALGCTVYFYCPTIAGTVLGAAVGLLAYAFILIACQVASLREIRALTSHATGPRAN
jgi:O-antigen/teichoic acid export membrane protein